MTATGDAVRRAVRFGVCLILTNGGLAGAGCSGHRQDHPLVNQPPHVRVTGGPRDGTRAHYQTRIYWSGWDDDGVIDHYEYALDPPEAFTQDEINAPERSPAVRVTRIPAGFQGQPDTLRVSKVDSSRTVSFDYLATRATDRIFELDASESDTVVNVLGRRVPDNTSSGTHTIYVRAMDTQGAYSDAGHLGFTAWTYTPTSWITYPRLDQKFLNTGGKLVVQWGGLDPDPPDRAKPNPVGYLYKLIDLHSLTPSLSVLNVADPQKVAFERAGKIPWTYVSGDTTHREFFVNAGEYLFALRAVDALGGVEPFLEFQGNEGAQGNAFLTLASPGGGRPDLTVTEPNVGTFTFRGNGLAEEIDFPAGLPLRFRWSASAESYGGSIAGYSWGLDIADLEQDTGWSQWGLGQTATSPLVFPKAGTHVLYVRAKDSVDSITIGSIIIRVYEFTFDREILYVDDYLSLYRPRDDEDDAFWEELFRNSGRLGERDLERDVLFHETGGPGDKSYPLPQPPSPRLLGRYKLVVWNVTGAGSCGRSGLFYAATRTTSLRLYLAAGGQLWLSGTMTMAPTREGTLCPDPNSPFYDGLTPPKPAGETAYPQAYVPGDFAWDCLKMHTEVLECDKAKLGEDRYWYNTLVAARAWNPASPALPDLEVDGDKVGPNWRNEGVPLTEAVIAPILSAGVEGFPGKLDSLYAYEAAGTVRDPDSQDARSYLQGTLCGTRWSNPDPDREQGRIMWFGFPLYYMKTDQAQEVMNRAIDWFREESPFDTASE